MQWSEFDRRVETQGMLREILIVERAIALPRAASDEFSGVVLLTRHNQPLVRRGYGLADRKAGRPNTPETPFMLSSVSKMFTAVTIAKLVERNQLSFDSTLGSILPEYPAEARDQATVRHLLTMSSGIPDLFRRRLRSLVSSLGRTQARRRLHPL
jgi:CubicO group peptidase (beta-lactamase class C family)